LKKLLLLLFLLPTLTQAEEFNLVCEGEEVNVSHKPDYILEEKKTIVIKVGENFLSFGNNFFPGTQKFDDDNFGKYESNYYKGKDSIVLSYWGQEDPGGQDIPGNDYCPEYDGTIKIDRITGVIREEQKKWDKCSSDFIFWHHTFEGKCKKQKENAF